MLKWIKQLWWSLFLIFKYSYFMTASLLFSYINEKNNVNIIYFILNRRIHIKNFKEISIRILCIWRMFISLKCMIRNFPKFRLNSILSIYLALSWFWNGSLELKHTCNIDFYVHTVYIYKNSSLINIANFKLYLSHTHTHTTQKWL